MRNNIHNYSPAKYYNFTTVNVFSFYKVFKS